MAHKSFEIQKVLDSCRVIGWIEAQEGFVTVWQRGDFELSGVMIGGIGHGWLVKAQGCCLLPDMRINVC